MPKLNGRLPKYRKHKNSGQAIVTLNGTDHYLGLYGSDPSLAEYDRLIAEWLGRGRRPGPSSAPVQPPAADNNHGDGERSVAGNVNRLIHGYWQHAEIHYRKPDGTATSELDNVRQAMRPLRRLYGTTDAGQFGPKSLKAVREHMITLGWCRSHINKQISRIKSVFRWGVENELVPPTIFHGLLAVKGLQRGRSTARESNPVRPVPEDRIVAVKNFISRQAWAIIQLQLLTGARAGELVGLRGIDLKTGDQIWIAEPDDHKTAHHGQKKRIYFGPQAKAVLQEFLQNRPLDRYLFSPNEAEVERRRKLHAARRTSLSFGNRPGTNRAKNPLRQPAECYTVDSYRQAIWRACDLAFPVPDHLKKIKVQGKRKRSLRWETSAETKERLGAEHWAERKAWIVSHRWHPHQLRHNAATHLRKEFGIEVARIILGHRSAAITEIYAELDDAKAVSVMQKIG